MDSNPTFLRSNKSEKQIRSINNNSVILAKLSALVLISVVFFTLFHFPTLPVLLGAGLAIYAAIILFRPFLWLLVIPALLPVLYLAPYSGWVFFDEFDLFLLTTLAVLLWNGAYSLPSLKNVPALSWTALIPFLAIYLYGIFNGLYPLQQIDANSFTSYYSHYNSLRVGKGLLWALLLWPALLHALDQTKKNKTLIYIGITLGAFGTVVGILRERGVIHDLFFATNWQERLQSFLDFSTPYRVTALFADMHTGGTSIDGYIALTIPLIFFLIVHSRGHLRLWSIFIAGGLLYGAAVTFSRGVYLALGVQLLVAGIVFFTHHRSSLTLRHLTIFLISALISLASLIVSYNKGGFFALFALLILYSGSSIIFASASLNKRMKFLLVSSLFLGSNALVIYAMSTSQWVDNKLPDSILYSLVLSVILVPASAISANILCKASGFRHFVVSIALFCIFVSTLLPALLGARVVDRFSTVSEDFQHRIGHWESAIEIANSNSKTALAGMGIGRFPLSYFWEIQDANEVGSYKIAKQNKNHFLSFSGAHDLRVGQIINIQPQTNYQLSFDYKTNDSLVPIYIRICHRQIIQPNEWNPTCKTLLRKEPKTDGKWKKIIWNFNSEKLGSFENMTVAPVVLTISNRRKYDFNNKPQTLLAIDNLTLRSFDGSQLLNNGSFEEGLNHWFGYYDFDHLPWHIKNIWVNYYFEIGGLGLISFLLLICVAIIRLIKSVLQGDASAPYLATAILGFLTVGSFGTIVDAPRIAMLFYLILLAALSGRIENKSRSLPI